MGVAEAPEWDDFGSLLRRCRLSAGLTQEALAERAGLGVRSIQGLESGKSRPRLETARRLIVALELAGELRVRFEAAARSSLPRHGPTGIEHLAAPGEASAPRTNLPLQLTSFVGREREIAEVKRLLGTTRLLTLTGTGGSGKTRLACQVAAKLLEEYADGVWLAELAPVTEPALVPQVVSVALGIREEPGLSISTTLLRVLRVKRLLLVVDNCEHLIDACARLVDGILHSCPEVQVLATSRESLGVASEVLWRVPSLTLPDPGRASEDRLTQYEAVRLFVERAELAQPGFRVNLQNAPAIAEICWRLDGIPLALELAAARVKMMPVEQLLGLLEDRFRVLTGGARTSLRRQQTLAATVDWSYDLLTDRERVLFDRLAVFAGGWDLEAAETVCNGAPLDSAEVLDLLGRLVDKSLVVYDVGQSGNARFRLLETLRQYGERKLGAGPELDALRHRHSAFYLQMAVAAEPELRGPQQVERLARLALDWANLRAAFGWLTENYRIHDAMEMAGALWRFWEVRGHWNEGRRLLSELIRQAPPERMAGQADAVRAKVLQGAGVLAFHQSDYGASRPLLEDSLAIFRAIGDKRGIAWSTMYVGWGINDGGNPAAARPVLEESLRVSREIGDRLGIAWALARLGLGAMFLGEFDRAAGLLSDSLRESRALGDRWGTAWSEHLLALTYALSTEPEPGLVERLQQDSLAIWRELGDRRDRAYSLLTLAMYHIVRGRLFGNEAYLRECLSIVVDLSDAFCLTVTLFTYQVLALAKGQTGRAACLGGMLESLRETTGIPVLPAIVGAFDEVTARGRRELGLVDVAAAHEAGRAMTLEQAVEYALMDDAETAKA